MMQSILAPVNIKRIKLEDPQLVYSLYIPLGENGIIQLVDKFRDDRNIELLDTDLYYFVRINYKNYIFTFYSRGLVKITHDPKDEDLWRILQDVDNPKTVIMSILHELLDTYQVSLTSMFEDIDDIPVHTTITTTRVIRMDTEYYDRNKEPEYLANQMKAIMEALSVDENFRRFLGHLRVMGNRPHEDVIIGTHGSLIRTEQIDILLSYHAYVRSLHLFLNEYNDIAHDIWDELSAFEEEISDFMSDLQEGEAKGFEISELFSNERRTKLSKIKSKILDGVSNIDQFLILIRFIQDSIEFTYDKYVQVREERDVKDNSFHIRKVLEILGDRASSSKIVSDNLVNRANSIVSRLDLLDTEITYEKQQRFEMITFFSSMVSIFIAFIAVIVSF